MEMKSKQTLVSVPLIFCKHSSCYSLGLFSFSFRHFSIYFTYKHPYIYDTICMISSIFIDYRYESKEQTENDMLCKTKTY